MTIICQFLTDYKNSLEDFSVNLQLNGYQKSHRTFRMLLHYLVKHSSAKQAINDKLQGNAGMCLRCGGVVNNQIKKDLLLSLRVKTITIGEYLAKLQAKRDCLVHFLLLAVCWPSAQLHETITLLLVTLPNTYQVQVQLHNTNADIHVSARLTVLLKAASELTSTVSGSLNCSIHSQSCLVQEVVLASLVLSGTYGRDCCGNEIESVAK